MCCKTCLQTKEVFGKREVKDYDMECERYEGRE